MDAAYISTVSALAGTVIGGLSTFATSWMTQTFQARNARLSAERMRRDELYSKFLEELARVYAHAVSDEDVDFSQLIAVYSLRGRILLQSSEAVARVADAALDHVQEVYMAPNGTAAEVFRRFQENDPMKPFADACRAELAALR